MSDTKLSGWYYDLQTDYENEGRMTCVTLHPSTKKPEGGKVEWDPYSGAGDEDDGFYRKEPIAIALMSEDFQVSIANTWSDFGGDMIGQLWDSIRPLAPYAEFVENAIKKANKSYQTAKSEGRIGKENTLSKAIGDALTTVGNELEGLKKKAGGGASDYLNMALVAMGTRFSYYSGTGIGFGSMVMKYYVLPKWDGQNIITVNEQLEDLYPFIMGHLMLDEKKAGDPDQLIAWQQAPGGFKSDYRDINTKQKGTLLLKYGGLYAVPNLVVEQVNLVFSKQAIKHPVPSKKLAQNYSPLFCEVTLQLRPASKFSDEALISFVNNTKILNKSHSAISGRMIK